MDHADAFLKIVAALKGLDRSTQERVIASVQALLGLSQNSSNVARASASVPERPASSSSSSSFSKDRTISAKEFVRDKDPRTDVERVACLAYYLAHYRNIPHFKTVDISSLNIEAAQPKFSNAAYSVENARSSGLLVAATGGNKQLSAIGEKYVECLPDREAAKAVLKPKRRSAK